MAKLGLGALYNKLATKKANERRKKNVEYFTQKARAEQSRRYNESEQTNKRLKSSSGARKAVGLAQGFTRGLSFVPIKEDPNETFGDFRYKQYVPQAAYDLATSVNRSRLKQQNLLNSFEDYKAANTVGTVGGTIAGAMATSGATKAIANKAMGTRLVRGTTDKISRILSHQVGTKAASQSAWRAAMRKALKRAAQNRGLDVAGEAVNRNVGRMVEGGVRGLTANVIQDVAYDTTFGAAKDISRYVESGKNPLKNKKDFAKYMAANAGANMVYGAIGNAILPAAKNLGKSKQYFVDVDALDAVPNRTGGYSHHIEKVPVPKRTIQQADALKDADYLNYLKQNGIDGKSVTQYARENGLNVVDVITDNYNDAMKSRVKAALKKATAEEAKDQTANAVKQNLDADSVAESAETKAKAAEVKPNKELSAKEVNADYSARVPEYAIGGKYGTRYINDSVSGFGDLLPGWRHMTADQYLKKYTDEGDAITRARKYGTTPSDERMWAKDRIAEHLGYRKMTDDEIAAWQADRAAATASEPISSIDEAAKQVPPINVTPAARQADQGATSATKQVPPVKTKAEPEKVTPPTPKKTKAKPPKKEKFVETDIDGYPYTEKDYIRDTIIAKGGTRDQVNKAIGEKSTARDVGRKYGEAATFSAKRRLELYGEARKKLDDVAAISKKAKRKAGKPVDVDVIPNKSEELPTAKVYGRNYGAKQYNRDMVVINGGDKFTDAQKRYAQGRLNKYFEATQQSSLMKGRTLAQQPTNVGSATKAAKQSDEGMLSYLKKETQTPNKETVKNAEPDLTSTVKEQPVESAASVKNVEPETPTIRQHTVQTNQASKAQRTVTDFVKHNNKRIGKDLDDWLSDSGTGKRYTESNPDAVNNAVKTLNDYGEDGVYKSIKMDVLESQNGLSNEQVAAGGILMDKWSDDIAAARKAGDKELAKSIEDKLDDLSAAMIQGASNNGRNLQAQKLLKQATPRGRVRAVELMAAQLRKRYGIKELKPDRGLLEMLGRATDDKDINEIQEAIAADIWDKIPPTLNEKFGAWRYLSMLFNPRTHVRNMMGNAAFTPIRGVRNTLEGGLQMAFDKKIKNLGGTRTKTIVNPASETYKRALQGGMEQWDAQKSMFYANNNKLTLGLNRSEGSAPLKNPLARGAYNFNSKMLNSEDEWCAAPAFQKSFANYLEANKIDYAKATKEQIEDASKVAYQDALEATYREKNALATWLNKLRKKAYVDWDSIKKLEGNKRTEALLEKLGGTALDTMAPFTNTPANIMKTGAVDFNPVQTFRGIYHIARARDAKELLDGIRQVSNGATGSGLYFLGAYLAHKGIARASINGDTQGYYDRDKGYQDYSFTIGNMKLGAGELLDLLSLGKVPESDGKTNLTMDWAMPAALPLFMGVEAYNAVVEAKKNAAAEAEEYGDDPRTGEVILNALGNYAISLPKMIDPVFQMSLLSSFSNVLDTSDAKKNGVSTEAQIGLNLAESRSGQYIPTSLGQISRTASSAKHNTTSTSSGMKAWTESFLRRQADKIPVVSGMVNPDKSDAFGQDVKGKESGKDYALSALENFLSPANVRKVRETGLDKEVQKLVDSGQPAKDVIPNTAFADNIRTQYENNKFRIDTHDLEKFNRLKGKYTLDKGSKLIKSDDYKNATNAEKAKMLNQLYTDAKQYANDEFAKSKGVSERDIVAANNSSYADKEKKLVKLGMKADNYAKVWKKVGEAKTALKERGLNMQRGAAYTVQSLASTEVSGGIHNAEQAEAATNTKPSTWKKVYNLSRAGFTAKQCVKFVLTDKERDQMPYYTKAGKKTNGVDKNKLTSYINNMNISTLEKWARYEVNRDADWTNPFDPF